MLCSTFRSGRLRAWALLALTFNVGLATPVIALVREVPGEYATVQAALDAALDGDLVLLAPGLYFENIKIRNAVTLASWHFSTGDASYIDTTVLDGSGDPLLPVISVSSKTPAGALITGLTIRNGQDGLVPFAPIDITHCVFRGNIDAIDFEHGSGGVVRFNLFEDNSDDALDLDGRLDPMIITDNVIRNNGEDGFEIRLEPYTGPTLEYTILRNEIYGNGQDGIQIIDYGVLTDRVLDIRNNTIFDNGYAGIGCLGNDRSTREIFDAANLGEPVFVVNNTFLNNGHGLSCGDNVVVVNNIFADHAVVALKRVDFNSVVDHNLFSGNTLDYLELPSAPTHSILADPLLDAALAPRAGSPAIDAGVSLFEWLGTAIVDLAPAEYSGVAPDLGAREFVGGPGALDTTPPFPPPDLQSPLQTPTTLQITWSGAFDDLGVASYRVFRDDVWIESTTGLSQTSTNLEPETSYDFQVSALDASGNESDRSPALSVSTLSASSLQSVEVRVGASDDDAEERINQGNAVVLDSSDLELTSDLSRVQVVGMRFSAVAIPRDAIIERAELQLTVDETSLAVTSLEIRGEAADDAAPFLAEPGNITSRVPTGNAVAWNPPAWDDVGASGPGQRTPDLSAIVQEIVGRAGWSSGKALVLSVSGSGARVAESYDGSPATAPVLEIDYRIGTVPADTEPPDAPADLVSPTQTASSISLSWSPSSDNVGVAAYLVFVDGSFTASTQSTSHSLESLSPDTLYDVTVRAVDGAGHESPSSSTLTVATLDSSAPTPTSVSVQVSASDDDAEERINSGGEIVLSSTDLELTLDRGREQVAGLRFRGVSIPHRATIANAHIQFTTDEVSRDGASLELRGQASGDASAFRDSPGDITSRPTTGASATWNPPPWNSVGESAADQRTSDLSALVQEIVNQPAWSPGNAMVFSISGSGSRVAASYDGSPGLAPVLEVIFGDGEPIVDITPPTVPKNVTSPAQTSSTVDLRWDASNDDVDVAAYRVHRNGALIGTTVGTAYTATGLAPSSAYAFQVSAVDAAGHESPASVVLTVSTRDDSIPITFRTRVAARLDDAEEEIGGGDVTTSSSDLELTEDSSSRTSAVGIRFRDVAVPPGAIVASASLQFTVDETSDAATTLEIRGQAADDASEFSSRSGDIVDRPTTASSAVWNPVPWNTVGAANGDQRSPDLRELVQEIVNRRGWTSGNALAFVITGSGSRVAESWDGSPAQAPELTIEFVAP